MKRIDAQDSKFIAKLDMKDSYHQVRLHEDLKNLTSFITDSGTYRFNVTPQGLNCSGDFFNEITDGIFSPCRQFLFKEVDDLMIFAPDKKTLMERLDKVCVLADQNGVSFSKDKLFLGQKTVFTGFQVDCSGSSPSIAPDPEKIRALVDMEAPNDKSDLRSFLGMVNSINLWHADSAYQTANL